MILRAKGSTRLALVVSAVLVIASPAMATPQFVPNGNERAHTQPIGPGIEWDTSGVLSGGQISYDSGTGIATVTAVVDNLNYYDPTNGSCATDTLGSNCSLNYSPDLDMTVQAKFSSITLTPIAGPFIWVDVNFVTTGGPYDLIVTDPADSNNVMLKASIAAGVFNGNATTGLMTRILYNTSTLEALFQTVNVSGFLAVDGSTLHASLFDDGTAGPSYFGLALTQVTDVDDGFGGGLDEVVAAAISSGILPSFTAEADGEAFAITSGEFSPVPEPTTAVLLGLGLIAMAAQRRRN